MDASAVLVLLRNYSVVGVAFVFKGYLRSLMAWYDTGTTVVHQPPEVGVTWQTLDPRATPHTEGCYFLGLTLQTVAPNSRYSGVSVVSRIIPGREKPPFKGGLLG